MTGTEKMIDTILQDAQREHEEILAQAKQQAGDIAAQAALQAEQESSAAVAAVQEKAAFDLASAQQRTAATEKRIVLQMKNEVIAETIAAAVQRLKTLPQADYFDMLAKLAQKHAMPGHGVMRFSQRDLERLPADFEKKLTDIEISQQPADITDGFVLVYGDIEQNCTMDALAAARLDDIKDALHAFIFAAS